ncbi:MAG: c-type cytochrome [bacterium]
MAFRLTSRRMLFTGALVSIGACAGNSGSAPASAPAPAAAQPSASMAVGALPAGVTAAMVAEGDSIFHKASCQRCHGMDAKGTPRAPDLTDTQWAQIGGTYPEIVTVITTGVPKAQIKMAGAPFGMQARGGTPALTDDQIKSVAAYVYSLSHH